MIKYDFQVASLSQAVRRPGNETNFRAALYSHPRVCLPTLLYTWVLARIVSIISLCSKFLYAARFSSRCFVCNKKICTLCIESSVHYYEYQVVMHRLLPDTSVTCTESVSLLSAMKDTRLFTCNLLERIAAPVNCSTTLHTQQNHKQFIMQSCLSSLSCTGLCRESLGSYKHCKSVPKIYTFFHTAHGQRMLGFTTAKGCIVITLQRSVPACNAAQPIFYDC